MRPDDWILVDIEESRKPGNEALYNMIDCFFAGGKLLENQPEEALVYFRDGRIKAEVLQKTWWVLFYDHWILQALLFGTHNYNEAHELAVKTTVEARKPHLADCPTRVCVHEDLISVYMGRDPIGYAEPIKDAIEYMEKEITSQMDCYFCLKGRRIGFEIAHDRIDTALDEAMHYLSITEENKHYHLHALSDLCEIAQIKEDWTSMLTWANAGKPIAIETDRRERVADFMAWQVLAHYKLGNPEQAESILNFLKIGVRAMGSILSGNYHDALCAYYEAKGDLRESLTLREQEVELNAGKGQYYHEAKVRLKHLRLLIQLQEETESAFKDVREVAKNLKKPDKILAEIEQLASQS